jgi:hypothetical protein
MRRIKNLMPLVLAVVAFGQTPAEKTDIWIAEHMDQEVDKAAVAALLKSVDTENEKRAFCAVGPSDPICAGKTAEQWRLEARNSEIAPHRLGETLAEWQSLTKIDPTNKQVNKLVSKTFKTGSGDLYSVDYTNITIPIDVRQLLIIPSEGVTPENVSLTALANALSQKTGRWQDINLTGWRFANGQLQDYQIIRSNHCPGACGQAVAIHEQALRNLDAYIDSMIDAEFYYKLHQK